MIKVVNIISDTNIGGAGKCIINFCKNYDKNKFEIVVVLPKESALIEELKSTSVKIIEIDGLKDKSLDLKSLPKLIKILRDERPDIVHTHASSIARLAARCVKDTKVVFTRHSVFPISEKIKSGIGRIIYKTTNEILSDRIIAVAEAAKENLTDGGIDENKIDVILNGVEKINETSEEEKKSLKAKYNIKDDEFVIGILARLEEVKGHDTFLETAKILLEEKKLKAKFLILGTGSREEELKEKVKKMNLESKIIFTGFIKNVQEFLNIFDLQVNCSFGTEATSLALLEGMSIGIPAVVTNFGGNPGVIQNGENGYIVPIKSPDEMANAIYKILNDEKKYYQMKNNSIDIFNKKFTAEVYTKNIEKFYQKVEEEPKIKRFNILDIFIILIAIIACILGYKLLKTDSSNNLDSNETKVVYKIRTNDVALNLYDFIDENTIIHDSLKNYNIGTLIKKECEPSVKYVVNETNKKIVESNLEGKIDIILTIEANATVSDKDIYVGNYELKVGNEAFVKGKGYAASGYIVSIER